MKKIFTAIFFLSLLIPSSAQRVIKYVTFYPVPYGSHQNLSVAEELYINMSNDVKAKVGGTVSVAGKSDFDGLVRVNSFNTDVVGTNGLMKSGNTAESKTGNAVLMPSASLGRVSATVGSCRITGTAAASGNTNLSSKSLSGLTNCSGSATWKALRLKGSEECKYYLTCGGAGGSSGCEAAPDMPEEPEIPDPKKCDKPNYYYNEKRKRCEYNSSYTTEIVTIHMVFEPGPAMWTGHDHYFDCKTVKSKTYYIGGGLVYHSPHYIQSYQIKNSYYRGWRGGEEINGASTMPSGYSGVKDLCDKYCTDGYCSIARYITNVRTMPTSSNPVYAYDNKGNRRPPENFSMGGGVSFCEDVTGWVEISQCK